MTAYLRTGVESIKKKIVLYFIYLRPIFHVNAVKLIVSGNLQGIVKSFYSL